MPHEEEEAWGTQLRQRLLRLKTLVERREFLGGAATPAGASLIGGAADAGGLRARIHKFNDISREFTRAAVHRERIARQYEQEGRTVPARENYFLAAHLYAGAQ